MKLELMDLVNNRNQIFILKYEFSRIVKLYEVYLSSIEGSYGYNNVIEQKVTFKRVIHLNEYDEEFSMNMNANSVLKPEFYSKDDLNLLVARNLSRIKRKDLDLLYLNDSIIGGEI